MRDLNVRSRNYDHLIPQKYASDFSLIRFLNSKLITLQYKLQVSDTLLGYPKHLIIDPINYCNLHCPLCPSGLRIIPRPKGRMSFELFKKVLREIGPYLYTLILTNWGEPLLHPELIQFIHFARRYPVYIGFSSNFHHLKRHDAAALITSGLDEIAFSIDGISQETYEKYRIGGNLEQVLDNVKYFMQLRAQLNSPKPRVRWQYLVTKDSESEMKQARELAQELLIDEIVFVPIYLGIHEFFTHSAQTRFTAYKHWLPNDTRYWIYDPSTGDLKHKPSLCHMLWDTLVVNWDGNVSPCCAVIDPKHDFGNLNQASVKNIWNGEKFRSARHLFRTQKAGAVPVICQLCQKQGVVIY